jgi:hypothetical protein
MPKRRNQKKGQAVDEDEDTSQAPNRTGEVEGQEGEADPATASTNEVQGEGTPVVQAQPPVNVLYCEGKILSTHVQLPDPLMALCSVLFTRGILRIRFELNKMHEMASGEPSRCLGKVLLGRYIVFVEVVIRLD